MLLILGGLLALVSVAFNRFSLPFLLLEDGHIFDWRWIWAIYATQLVGFAIAICVLAFGGRLRLLRRFFWLSVPLLVACVVAGSYGTAARLRIRSEIKQNWTEIQVSEDLHLALTPRIRLLGKSVMNATLPDHHSFDLFADRVRHNDIAEPTSAGQRLETIATELDSWPVTQSGNTPAKQLRLWRPLLDDVDYFQHATFKPTKNRFVNSDQTKFETDVAFSGLAVLRDGTLRSVKAQLLLLWQQQPGKTADEDVSADWRITHIDTKSLQTLSADGTLFTDVLEQVVSPELVATARESRHQRLLERWISDPAGFQQPELDVEPPYEDWFQPYAGDRHPGVSVVDIDRDGFDDLYVMARWGKNLFFRNRGNGTFEEIGAEIGLDVEDHCSCALFADFDNDGDDDLMLGRTLARSMYLRNEEGQFRDRSAELVDDDLPYFVSSLSAADYNGDGLLDVYYSTYAIVMLAYQHGRERFYHDNFLTKYLPREEAEEVHRLSFSREFESPTNVFGPPNRVYRNIGGGRFEIDRKADALSVLKNTYQATWSDYDRDGDPDVYVANDFSKNNLFRNDGDSHFVDVTEETETADIGFGMGASWGDYDNDGRHDLYVANMYSKAGKRITAKISRDPRLRQMAMGNSLFRNRQDGPFERVSGEAPPQLMVEVAGWSWGAQFLDFDNDGWLDIYGLSGMYSAPPQFAVDHDL